MFTAYIVVTVLAAAANIFSATLDFIRFKQVLINMAKAGVPESWITMLGALKGAGRSDCWSASACHRSGRLRQSASSCSLSVPSSLTCAHTTTRSVSRSCSFYWPWPHWYCDWPHGEQQGAGS